MMPMMMTRMPRTRTTPEPEPLSSVAVRVVGASAVSAGRAGSLLGVVSDIGSSFSAKGRIGTSTMTGSTWILNDCAGRFSAAGRGGGRTRGGRGDQLAVVRAVQRL